MTSGEYLEDQIRECFGRVVYTHKTHEKMADLCTARLRHIKVWQIVISAVSSCGAIGVVISDDYKTLLALVTAAVSFASVFLSTYMKGFDPGGNAQKHRDIASNLWNVRESYLSLLTDLRRGAIDQNSAASRRDELQVTLGRLYKGAPQTSPEAYALAQKSLKDSEDYTFSETEIDMFVPGPLRKSTEGRR
jgi:hypothetical protein